MCMVLNVIKGGKVTAKIREKICFLFAAQKYSDNEKMLNVVCNNTKEWFRNNSRSDFMYK